MRFIVSPPALIRPRSFSPGGSSSVSSGSRPVFERAASFVGVFTHQRLMMDCHAEILGAGGCTWIFSPLFCVEAPTTKVFICSIGVLKLAGRRNHRAVLSLPQVVQMGGINAFPAGYANLHPDPGRYFSKERGSTVLSVL